MSGMFVIIEWNQASHQPEVCVDDVFDTREEAEEMTATLRASMAEYGRRDRYTVHELSDEEPTDD